MTNVIISECVLPKDKFI